MTNSSTFSRKNNGWVILILALQTTNSNLWVPFRGRSMGLGLVTMFFEKKQTQRTYPWNLSKRPSQKSSFRFDGEIFKIKSSDSELLMSDVVTVQVQMSGAYNDSEEDAANLPMQLTTSTHLTCQQRRRCCVAAQKGQKADAQFQCHPSVISW